MKNKTKKGWKNDIELATEWLLSRAMYWVTMSHIRTSNTLQQAEENRCFFIFSRKEKKKISPRGKMKA